MKIGVDAGALGVSDERLKVGVYRVIVNLLRELSVLDEKNKYILYSFDPIDRGVMSQFGPNMENEVLWPVKGWFRLRLPLELKLRPVDVFLGVSQAIPRSKSYNIGFIYDLGFLSHPNEYRGSYTKLKKQTESLVSRSDAIVTISQYVKDDVIKTYAGNKENIVVAHPGVDRQFSCEGDAFVDARPYFLFVGALKAGKNIPMAIAAFAKFLAREKKPYDFLLVGGDFWRDPAIEKAIHTFHLKERVRPLGFISDSEVAEYYRGAVSFVSPSLHEGFCLPAIEAMASGCPVIGSTAGAIPEIVGDAGILVHPTDVDALAQAFTTIAHNVAKRKAFVKKGLARAKRFSWQAFSKTTYRLIQSAHET